MLKNEYFEMRRRGPFGHMDDDIFVIHLDHVPTEEEKELMEDKWRDICQSKSLNEATEKLRKASREDPRFHDTLKNRNVPVDYIIYPTCDLVLVEHENDSTGKKYLFRAPFNSGLKIGDEAYVSPNISMKLV